MADEADLASEQLNNELARAISRIRQTNTATGQGAKHCADCGEDIPKARRDLGLKLCIVCAESRERRRSLFAEN